MTGGRTRDERGTARTDEAGTARLLERALVRFHPSFRFEEQLAARLASVAGPPEPAAIIPFPLTSPGRIRHGRDRRVLVGGAVASGVSLAGAAVVVAWLRGRPA